jgi:Zn-dependent oligopeptidase
MLHDTILAPGGSESMNVLVRRFLGRDWSTEAYLARVKVSEPAQARIEGAC